MKNELDSIHHIAIKVNNIQESIDWYCKHLKCTVAYQDESWGLLKFSNISLALVLPNTHPPHIGIPCDEPEKYGVVKPHRDGTASTYIPDPSGNYVEMIKLNDTEKQD